MQHLPEPIEGGEGLKKGWKMDDTFFHAIFGVYASIFWKKKGKKNPLKIGDFIFSSLKRSKVNQPWQLDLDPKLLGLSLSFSVFVF